MINRKKFLLSVCLDLVTLFASLTGFVIVTNALSVSERGYVAIVLSGCGVAAIFGTLVSGSLDYVISGQSSLASEFFGFIAKRAFHICVISGIVTVVTLSFTPELSFSAAAALFSGGVSLIVWGGFQVVLNRVGLQSVAYALNAVFAILLLLVLITLLAIDCITPNWVIISTTISYGLTPLAALILSAFYGKKIEAPAYEHRTANANIRNGKMFVVDMAIGVITRYSTWWFGSFSSIEEVGRLRFLLFFYDGMLKFVRIAMTFLKPIFLAGLASRRTLLIMTFINAGVIVLLGFILEYRDNYFVRLVFGEQYETVFGLFPLVCLAALVASGFVITNTRVNVSFNFPVDNILITVLIAILVIVTVAVFENALIAFFASQSLLFFCYLLFQSRARPS